MTDSDRLREAADHIDIAWDSMESHAPRWATEHDKVGRATAALLRAVAGDHDDDFCTCMFQAVGNPPGRSCAAALAVADAILGGES